MKKVNLQKLIWINECRNALFNGYSEYLMKTFKKTKPWNNDGPSVFALTAVLFGESDGKKTKEEKFSSEFFNFVNNYKIICPHGDEIEFIGSINEKKLNVTTFELLLNFLFTQFEHKILNEINDEVKTVKI